MLIDVHLTRFIRALSGLLCCLFAVDHPRYSEPVDEHPKSHGPESFPEWHRHPTVLLQSAKYTFRLSWVRDTDVYREALRFLSVGRRGVTTHQYLAANYHAGMDDFAAPLRRY